MPCSVRYVWTVPIRESVIIASAISSQLIRRRQSLKQAIELVDVPGHPRLRTRLLAQYASTAKAVVFCVDQAGFSIKGIRDTAESVSALPGTGWPRELNGVATQMPSRLARSFVVITKSSTDAHCPDKVGPITSTLDRQGKSITGTRARQATDISSRRPGRRTRSGQRSYFVGLFCISERSAVCAREQEEGDHVAPGGRVRHPRDGRGVPVRGRFRMGQVGHRCRVGDEQRARRERRRSRNAIPLRALIL